MDPGRRIIFGLVAIGAVLALMAATVGAPVPPVAAQEPDGRDWSFLAQQAETDSLADDFPGGVLIVVDREEGVVYHDAYGDFETDRISMIASSSKAVSAGILMSLHQDGILDIDQPVAEITGWTGVHEGLLPRHLVSANSGLQGLRPDFLYGPYLCQWAIDWNLQDCGREIATTIGDDGDVVPVETEYRYGGGSWMVAGAVAEIASGKSWNELFTEYVAEPCGLENSGFQNIVAMGSFGGYPYGFAGDPTLHPEHANPTIEGGMYTSTSDYAKILLMHLRGGVCENGRVFTEENLARLHSPQVPKNNFDNDYYAMGWHLEGDTNVMHSDGLWGTYPWINHEHGYGAFWLFEGDYRVSRRIERFLMHEVHRQMTGEQELGYFDAPVATPGDAPGEFSIAPSGSGDLWYTTDGTDPATFDGAPSAGAMRYSAPLTGLGNDASELRVRQLSADGEWSRLETVQLGQAALTIGDADCDGVATIVDALMIAQLSVGSRTDSACPLQDPLFQANAAAGDYNQDGDTNIVDALIVARCVVGACPF